MKLLLVTLLVGVLSGCATEPISLAAATPIPENYQLMYHQVGEESVPVTIVRDGGLAGSGCAARVLVNDKVAAYVRSGQVVTLHMPPGEYILAADFNTGGLCQTTGLAEIEANFQLKTPRLYRISMTADGAIRLMRTMER